MLELEMYEVNPALMWIVLKDSVVNGIKQLPCFQSHQPRFEEVQEPCHILINSVCIRKVTLFMPGREQRYQSSTHPWSGHKETDIHLNFTVPALSQGHPKAALRRAVQSSRCLKRQCMLLGKIVPKSQIGLLSLSLWLIDPCNVHLSRRGTDFSSQCPAKSCIMHSIKTTKCFSSYTAFPVNTNSLPWLGGS